MTYILSHGIEDNKQTILLTSDISIVRAEIEGGLHDMGVKDYREYQPEEGVTVIDYGEPTCYFIEEIGLSLTKDPLNTLDYKKPIVRKQDIFKAIAKDILMIDGIDNIELGDQFIRVPLFTEEDEDDHGFPILILEDSNGIEVSYNTFKIINFTLSLSTLEDVIYYMRKIQKIVEFHTKKI